MKIFRILAGLIFVTLMLGTHLQVTIASAEDVNTYYVSPFGDNANEGTQTNPWRDIQYAVDSSNSGDIIKVMDDDDETTDDYIENVTINKSLTIEKNDSTGTNPQVTAMNPSAHIFLLVSDGVKLSGLDIYGSEGGYVAVYLGGANGCVISQNRIGYDSDHRNYIGLYLNQSEDNLITKNEINFNSFAIYAEFSSDGNSIVDNSFISNRETITIKSSDNISLIGNTCKDNGMGAISVNDSSNSIIVGNLVDGAYSWGIELNDSGSPSNNNLISNNICKSVTNGYGILQGAGEPSYGNRVLNNTCSQNYIGIGLSRANDSEVFGNTCISNYYGMSLSGATGNTISANSFSLNEYAMNISNSNNNTIYLNNFTENEVNLHPYYWFSSSWNSANQITYVYNGNTFYNYLGNYYDDYTGIDVDGDGVGDTDLPYTSGDIDDNYPLMSSSVPVALTDEASNISFVSTTLNGYLNSLNYYNSVDVSFVWGTDSQTNPSQYPNETTFQEMTSVNAFSADIISLDQNTTYFFRSKLTADEVIVYGSEKSFTTPLGIPPEADAGPDQSTFVGLTVTLDGSGSYDADGSIVKYEWDVGDGAPCSDWVICFTVFNVPGAKTVTLSVTDDDGLTDTDSAIITVKTPIEGVGDLVSEIEKIHLPEDIDSGLIDKLDATLKSIFMSKYKTAVNQLNAFIRQVDAQRDKTLTDVQADALIQMAQDIMASLISDNLSV